MAADGVTATTRIAVGAITLEVREWAALFGVPPNRVVARIRRGWPPHEAISAPGWVRRWQDPLPYELDLEVRRFVADHPGGASLQEIADFFGLGKERIRQIVDGALARLQGTEVWHDEQPWRRD